MPVRAGTAYVKIDADFSQFNREVHAKLNERLTQQVHVKADTSSVRRAETDVRSFTGSSDKAHISIGNLSGGFRKLYTEAAKITLVGLGAQAISALAAGAVEATSALAPLGGALAAVPALASAGAQGLGVWKLAFSGVTTAVGGLNQRLDKSSKAFRELTPEGKKFAEQLERMKQPLRDLSQTAQKGLLPGLEAGIKSAMGNFGVLQKGVGATAKVMGDLATEAGKLVGSKGFGRDLGTQMARNEVTIRRLGEAGLYLADAMVQITLAAGPLVDWMTRTTLSVAKQVDAWAKNGRESGKFAAFLRETRHVMTDVGHIAVDLGTGLANIFKAAYPQGRGMLDLLTHLSDKFRDWTTSATGQNKIHDYFKRAQPAINEAGKLVGAIVKDFLTLGSGKQIAPLLRTIRVDLLPKLTDMVNKTQAAFGKPFLDALGQVVTLFTNLGGSSGALTLSARVVGTVVGATNRLLNIFPILKPVIATIITVGAIGKILKLDSAIGGMRTLIGLMRRIPGVSIPSIGGGGPSGGVSSLLSKEVSMLKPVPVYVVGGDFGPPGTPTTGRPGQTGVPTSVGGAAAAGAEKQAKGIVGKLGPALNRTLGAVGTGAGVFFGGSMASSIVGQIVGGKAGDKIASIGSKASLWGGMGATAGGLVAGPLGAAIGGAGGAAIGIMTSLFEKHAPDYQKWGKTIAHNVNQGISDAGGVDLSYLDPARAGAEKQFDAAGVKAVDAFHKAAGRRTAKYGPRGSIILPVQAPDRKEMDKQSKLAVDNFYGSFAEHIQAQKFWTSDTFMRPVEATMKQLPKALRGPMGEAMIASARELQREGRLPRGAAADIARRIARTFGGLPKPLAKAAHDGVSAVKREFQREDAVNAAENMRKKILRNFTDMPKAVGRSGHGAAQNFISEMDYLANKAAHSTGRVRKQALSDFDQVAKQAKRKSHDAEVDFVANLETMRVRGGDKSRKTKESVLGQFEELRKKSGPKWRGIKSDAITAFTDLQNGVVPTGDRTAEALYNAFKAMGVNANQLAAALGIKPIQLKLTPLQKAVGHMGPHTTADLVAGHAGGGLIQIGQPGAAGRDTVALNMGGIPIAVGEGEQVAVFNRHQAPIMDEALSRMGYGGLPGLFRRVNKLNYMAGGGILPKRRFAGGGTFSYGQLEGLWNQAGGAPNMAPLMAAIALAESGGNAGIVNSIGASGLWQIHPAMPGDLNPLQNARYAVGKLRSQGLRAWETYTSGAYRAFLHGGVPAIGGAGVTEIARAIISGPAGAAKDLAQGGADWARKRINSYLASHMPVAGPGGVSTAGVTGAGGLGSFDGLRVANWIVPILNWARSHGWTGHITSGYRPGAITNTGNLSNHARADYPGGAVDVGDQHAIAQGEALWNVVKGYTGSPKLYSAAFGPGAWGPYKDSPHDYGHFSATGHAGGGLVQGFNGGGHPRTMLGHRAITHHTPWWQHALEDLKHSKIPSGPKLEGLLGNLRHIGLTGWDKPLAKHSGDVSRDATLEGVAAGLIDTTKITDMLTANPTLWPDPTKPISEAAIHTILRRTGAVVQGKDALQWLGTELGHQMALRRSLIKLAQHVKQQYETRAKILAAAKLRRKALAADVHRLNLLLHPKGKHAKAPTGAHRKTLSTELATATRQLAGVQSVITVTENQMGSLSTAWGAPLGGVSLKSTYDLYGPTTSGGSGTEGVLGQLYALQGPVRSPRVFGLGSSARDLIKALPGSVKNWYGDIGTTLSSMTGFGSSFFTAPSAADAADVTGPTIDPFSLELQRLASQRSLIGQLQGPLISAYPYGGSFAAGGTVPGPPGMPVMIQAHGGEQVISLDDQGGSHTVEIHGDARTVALLETMIETVNVRSNRGQARSADRRMRLPGNQVR